MLNTKVLMASRDGDGSGCANNSDKSFMVLFQQIAPVQALDLVDGFWWLPHSYSHL